MAKPTWEKPIRSFFRQSDIEAMSSWFNLASYSDVKNHAKHIYERLTDKNQDIMPCDGAWPDEKIAIFKEWVDSGTPEK